MVKYNNKTDDLADSKRQNKCAADFVFAVYVKLYDPRNKIFINIKHLIEITLKRTPSSWPNGVFVELKIFRRMMYY